MATHPYISGAGNVTQMVQQLRKAFPATVNAETVKRLGIAPNNESYVINILHFIGVIDGEGKKTDAAAKTFSAHKDQDFYEKLSGLIQTAYKDLFDLHGDNAWLLSNDDLITFFRQSDQTSAIIGGRQAATFRALAALSGHGEVLELKNKKTVKIMGASKNAAAKTRQYQSIKPEANAHTKAGGNSAGEPNIGLTVRVEINLPADGSKEVYDNIFKSIKDNLLRGS